MKTRKDRTKQSAKGKRRRQQIAASVPEQLSLFEMREDRRPVLARSAGDRYREPGLFDSARDRA